MRVLVTGAAGFIGSHVAEALHERGDDVLAVDSFDDYYDPARKRATWRELAARGARLRLVEGDLTAPGVARELALDRDLVVHLAARPGVRASIEDPRRTYHANVDASLALLEAMRASGAAKRLVLASTSSVYGGDAPLPFHEDAPSSRPLSPYAASKRAVELLASTYVQLHGLGALAVRLFTVYGPRGRPDMSVGRFVEACLAGERVPLFGDGTVTRDFTYIDDIVRGILLAADHVRPGGWDVLNLGGAERRAVSELVALVEKECGRPLLLARRPSAPGDAPTTWASAEKAERVLGWSARVRPLEGIAKTVPLAKGRAESGRPSRTQGVEAFLLGGHEERVVERDEAAATGLAIAGDARRGKLERVGGAQRMHAKNPRRLAPNRFDRVDLGPLRHEFGELSLRLLAGIRLECPPPFETRESRDDLDLREIPHDLPRIVPQHPAARRRPRFIDHQRNDRGAVPELQRPLRRSSRSAFTARPPGSFGRGPKRCFGRRCPSFRTPRFASDSRISHQSSSSPEPEGSIGTRSATGLLRS